MARRCWICGRSRAHEAFSGKGHAQGICRDCWPKRPHHRDELNLMRNLRRLESKGYVRSDAPDVVRRILASPYEGLRREAAGLIRFHLSARGMVDLAMEHARSDRDIEVRIACLHALGSGVENFHLVDEQGLENIPGVIVRRAAAHAKELLLSVARDASASAPCRFAAVASLGLFSHEPDVAREIDALFDDGTEAALCAALDAASRRCDVYWDQRIIPCLLHPAKAVRAFAAQAAKACWIQDGHEALRRLCFDPDAETAGDALEAYARIGDLEDVEEVIAQVRKRPGEMIEIAASQAEEYVDLRKQIGGAPLEGDDAFPADDFDDDIPF